MNEQHDLANPQTPLQEMPAGGGPAAALAALLYDRTAQNKVAGKKWLVKNLPEDLDREKLEEMLSAVDIGQPEEPLKDAAFIKGRRDRYYYDASIMTPQYAQLDALIEDKDILHTIASVTRSDCRLYPRPTEFSKMTGYPFHFTQDEVEGAAARMRLSEEYKDIGVVQASNGEKAFFSSDIIKEGYARALLEASEVESKQWP